MIRERSIFKVIMISIPVIIFIVGLSILEIHLRSDFYYPGSFLRFFQPVDSLETFSEVYADSLGIQRYNVEYLNQHTEYKKIDIYANAHGFRSRPFVPKNNRDSKKKVILFLGDSNTWGASAEPVSKCFADLVDSAGYISYNTGMPGSDITQNLGIARAYIPILQPDICIFTFNHIQWFKRPLVPFIPLDYWTSAGILEAWKADLIPGSEGEYFESAETAYEYYLENYTLFNSKAGYMESVCSKSVVLTNLYRLLSRWQDPANHVEYPKAPVVKDYLNEIEAICEANGVEFITFMVPSLIDIGKDAEMLESESPGLFGKYRPMVPPDLTIEDFVVIEAHMNNKGHRKMADFILSELEKVD